MSNQWRRVLAIIALFATAGGIGYLLYYFFFRGNVPPPALEVIPSVEAPVIGLPVAEIAPPITAGIALDAAPGQILPRAAELSGAEVYSISPVASGSATETVNLSNAEISEFSLTSDGQNMVFFNKDDGKFYKINNLGEREALSDKIFYNVDKVNWAPDSSKGILEYPDGSKIMYDFKNRKQTTLPDNWEEFSFSSDSKKIVFKEQSSNADYRWISTANADGSGKRVVEHMGINDDKVIINMSPNNSVVAMYDEPSGNERSTVYFIGQNKENFKSMYVEGYGFQPKWSSDGNRLLYSTFSSDNDYNPSLWIVNATGDNIGQNRINMKINTWAEKCTFYNQSTIYCAVPNYMEYGSGFEPELSKDIPDSIFKINIDTGSLTKIAETDTGASIKNLTISEDESNLYFTDNATNNLHKLRLK